MRAPPRAPAPITAAGSSAGSEVSKDLYDWYSRPGAGAEAATSTAASGEVIYQATSALVNRPGVDDGGGEVEASEDLSGLYSQLFKDRSNNHGDDVKGVEEDRSNNHGDAVEGVEDEFNGFGDGNG